MSNVLVITTDDQRYDELQYMPNTRRLLAGRGSSFNWTRCNVPLCSPARVGLLSGQNSKTHGITMNSQNPSTTLYNSSVFVALHNAGFRVGAIGKFLTELSGMGVKPGFDFWRAIVGDGGSGYGLYEPNTYTVFNGSTTTAPGIYQDHYLAGQALDFMRGSEPWCLWYCPTSPHWPFSSPPNHTTEWGYRTYPTVDETSVADKPSWIQALPAIDATMWADLQADQVQRLRELLAVDDAIGAFVGLIDSTGIASRTTVIFVSDNGNMLGEHRIIGPLGARAGNKNSPYDGSLRVPMIAAGPGLAHQKVTCPTIQQDITATMLDIANVASLLPLQAGVSLLDIASAFAADPTAYSARTTLHRRTNLAPEGSPDTIPSADGVAGAQYKLWRYVGQSGTDQYELYDLLNDPQELTNQANAGGSWLTLRNTLESSLNALLA